LIRNTRSLARASANSSAWRVAIGLARSLWGVPCVIFVCAIWRLPSSKQLWMCSRKCRSGSSEYTYRILRSTYRMHVQNTSIHHEGTECTTHPLFLASQQLHTPWYDRILVWRRSYRSVRVLPITCLQLLKLAAGARLPVAERGLVRGAGLGCWQGQGAP
jgi:hypothetical protein